jgi:hypothetical protein
MSLHPGSYVIHNKLPELGSGEILSVDKGATRVRFASGERNFLTSVVEQHLTVTLAAPVVEARTTARKSKRKAPPEPK